MSLRCVAIEGAPGALVEPVPVVPSSVKPSGSALATRPMGRVQVVPGRDQGVMLKNVLQYYKHGGTDLERGF